MNNFLLWIQLLIILHSQYYSSPSHYVPAGKNYLIRMERDLPTRTDRMGVEVRERTMWDIRTGVVGADTFLPKHVAIITWKNVSFAGGIDLSLYTVS